MTPSRRVGPRRASRAGGFVRPTFELDAAALLRLPLRQPKSVQAGDGGYQAQSETRTGGATAPVPPVEPAQELRKLPRCDPWASVGHTDRGSLRLMPQ
jgi:hypothetical protein